MRGKAALVVGLAAGYVLGARDGRERYEQIKAQANRLRNDPRVQEKASQATDLAKEKAPVLKDKVASATHRGAGTDQDTGTGSSGSSGSSFSSGGTGSDGSAGSQGSAGTGAGDPVDATSEEGAIIVTAPPPSPLEPGATSENTTAGGLGG